MRRPRSTGCRGFPMNLRRKSGDVLDPDCCSPAGDRRSPSPRRASGLARAASTSWHRVPSTWARRRRPCVFRSRVWLFPKSAPHLKKRCDLRLPSKFVPLHRARSTLRRRAISSRQSEKRRPTNQIKRKVRPLKNRGPLLPSLRSPCLQSCRSRGSRASSKARPAGWSRSAHSARCSRRSSVGATWRVPIRR